MEFKKHLMILEVIERLNKYGSWTGKTHVQKALFLLSATGKAVVPFQFVLYKHGPYSFDIEDEMEQMKGYAGIVSAPMSGYGVTLDTGSSAPFIRKEARLTDGEKAEIERVCKFVGSKKVTELERIATAAWIRTRENITDAVKVAARLHALKPHVSTSEAAEADCAVLPLLNGKKSPV